MRGAQWDSYLGVDCVLSKARNRKHQHNTSIESDADPTVGSKFEDHQNAVA